jgi:hypothetical protein
VAASVYLETSIISYLVARPSRDIVTAAHQQTSLEWWSLQRNEFDLYVSELHMAIATVQGIEYLLTWNCPHIANARVRVHIERTCRERGLAPPVLCMPEELMGDLE